MTLLTLTHWVAALLSLMPALVNLFIFIKIWFKKNKRQIHVIFALFIISLFLWQMGDVFIRLSINEQIAEYWVVSLGNYTSLLLPFGLHFVLLFTKRTQSRYISLILLALYLSGIFFFTLNALGYISFSYVNDSFWGFLTKMDSTLYNYIYGAWVTTLALLMMYFLIEFMIRTKSRSRSKYKQSLFMGLGLSIPVVQGIITQIIYPLILNKPPVPLASSLMIFFSIGALIGLNEYKMLSSSAFNIWPIVSGHIKEGIMVMDRNNTVKYANRQFIRILNLSYEEVIGKPVDVISQQLSDSGFPLPISKNSRNNMVFFTDARNNKAIWLNWKTIAYKNQDGHMKGYICIMNDISDHIIRENRLLKTTINLLEKERSVFAHDLLENVCQRLFALKILLEYECSNVESTGLKEDVLSTVGEVLNQTRDISSQMTPAMLEVKSMEDLLMDLGDIHRNQIDLQINCLSLNGTIQDKNLKLAIYRIANDLIQYSIIYINAMEGGSGKGSIILNYENPNILFDYYDYNYSTGGESLPLEDNYMDFTNPESIVNIRVKALGGQLSRTIIEGVGIRVKIVIPFSINSVYNDS